MSPKGLSKTRYLGGVFWCVLPSPEFSTPLYCYLIQELCKGHLQGKVAIFETMLSPKSRFDPRVFGALRAFAKSPYWPTAVKSSIAVEDAVENRGLYRVFVARLFLRGLRHYSATIAWLSPPKRFRTRRLRTPTCAGMRDRAR